MEIEILAAAVAVAALGNGLFDFIKSYLQVKSEAKKDEGKGAVRIVIENAAGEIKEIRLESNDLASISSALSDFEETDHVRSIEAG